MIEFTKEAYLFCIIAGLFIYVGFFVLTVLIAFLVEGLKVGRFLKSRRFLFSVVFGIIAFPCLSVLTWWTYSFCSLHSTVNKLKTCDSIKIVVFPGLFHNLSMPDDYVDSKSFVEDDLLLRPAMLVTADKNVINSLAHKISMTTYRVGTPGETYITNWFMLISLLKNEESIDAFTIVSNDNLATGRYGNLVASEDLQGQIFRILPQTRPIAMRASCAVNLRHLGSRLHEYAGSFNNKYPDPNLWCDLLIGPGRHPEGGFTGVRSKDLYCEAAGKGDCHYAINPFCLPDSPNDVVLLFETSAGWNQHGGPELMAFDHHEPNGCHVLLNDGKIKFITPDHVADLRWKPRRK